MYSQISRFIPFRIKKGHEGASRFEGARTFVAFIIFNYVAPAIKAWGAMPVGLYLNFDHNVSDFSRSYKTVLHTEILLVCQCFSAVFLFFHITYKISEKRRRLSRRIIPVAARTEFYD